jgi:hypothetical protein
MNENIIKNSFNFIEQSCNDVTKNIIGGFTSPIEKVILKNVENISKLSPIPEHIFSGDDIVKTNYILFGYEMSSTVFIILMTVLLLIVLYFIYKILKWFFVSPHNELVTMNKFSPIKKNKPSHHNTDSDNSSDDSSDELDASISNKSL